MHSTWGSAARPGQSSVENDVGLTFKRAYGRRCIIAGVIQLVECQLPKLDVAGSSPVARS
jgi:hypothetical protein